MNRMIFAIATIIFGLTSCTKYSEVKLKDSSKKKIQSFLIDGTEFEIDLLKSSFKIDLSSSEKPLITIEVYGDKKIFDIISKPEKSKWFWASYRPHLYVRSFAAVFANKNSNKLIANGSPNDTEKYEIAIYMMQHNQISDLTITILNEKELEVTGRVDLVGKNCPFKIHWLK